MDNTEFLNNKLASGLDALGLSLAPPALSGLLAYCDLLIKWNRTYNLTSISDPEQVVSHHLLDSLAVLPHLPAGRVIDVGTGAGLPGMPLAIARPQQQFVLLDANGKKTRFLVQAVGQLALDNVGIVNERVEAYRPDGLFDTVISRAFSSLEQMLLACDHLLAEGGRFLAMKGKYPESELQQLPPGFQLISSVELRVPGLNAERHLLMLGRS